VPVGEKEYPGARGQVWAEPDIDGAAAAIRRIAADAVLAERLDSAGKARIRGLYDPRVTGARYVGRLRAIANRHGS
jgi:hypothetical protein